MKQKTTYLHFFILFSVALVALFQISFNLHPVKFDSIDCFYPWRFYIGECLQNGQLPYWNPFQDLGYPIHADPSSGAWYPMVWLIGYFNGYSIYSIGFELWIHIFFAGMGFYTLTKTLKFESQYALLAAISYMLCGLFIGNAQHLPYIISAAWLPFVLNYYFRLVNEKTFLNSLKAAFFLFLMITGGYPAFTIILFYLLLIFFVIYFIKTRKTGTKSEMYFFLFRHAVFLAYTILMSLVLLVSIYQVSPYMSRLGHFSIEQGLFSPFSPQSFISFILPLTSTTNTDFFNSDLSMRNGYFGLFFVLFFIVGFFKKKPLEIKVLFYFGLFALTAAVGASLPIRELLFRYVPLMNVFRFPSVFRLFFIIPAILTGLYYLKTALESEKINKKPLIVVASTLIIGFISLIFIGRNYGYLNLGNFIKSNLFVESSTSTYWQNTAVQSIIQIGFLIVFIGLIWKIKNKIQLIIYITILSFLDLFLASQLNAPYTVYYSKIAAKEADSNSRKLPKGFPIQNNNSIEENGHLPAMGTPFWQNLNTFQKQISAEGFNSFSFTNYEFLESEYPQLFFEIKKNTLLSINDTILSENQLVAFKKDSLFSKNQLFFDQADYDYLIQRSFEKTKGDTVELKSYDAAHFSISCTTHHRVLLTLHQKEYKGWKAKVNGKKARIFKSNLNFMTIMVPAGKNEILFEYKNPVLKISFYISAFFILFALAAIGYNTYLMKKKK